MQSDQSGLRNRSVNVWQAIGVSVALMAPAMAASINPQAAGTTVGRAVPLAFTLATIGALLVAYSFVRLTQRFHHAGSVYGFVGATIGPRAGIFSGWLLVSTYAFFAALTALVAGRFANSEIQVSGLWSSPDWFAFVLAFVALAIVLRVATLQIDGGTTLMLVVEATTVTLILIICAIVLAKVVGHSAPGGQHFDLHVFSPPSGTGASSVFLGVVFGFLSFAGFEAAATLGEESENPRRDVPRAVAGTVVVGGLFFIFVTAVEMMGFGANAKGVAAFVASGSLIGDLGTSFIGSWIGHVVTIGAMISALSCSTACTVGASRLMYALSRDGAGPRALTRLSRAQTPATASAVVLVFGYLAFAVGWIVSKGTTLDIVVAAGEGGTLILLVAYALATVGAMRLLFFSGERTVAPWEAVVPTAGLVVLGYTMYRNLNPWPTGSTAWGVEAFLLFLVLALGFVVLRSDVARSAGERLNASEGLGRPRQGGEAAVPEAGTGVPLA